MIETIRYPVSGETPFRTLAIGAVLSALGVLVVPAILVAGYYGRVLARSAAGDDRPPSFDGWRALFVQGLETWIVVAAYFSVGLVAVLLLVGASVVLGDLGTGAGAAVGLLALVVAGLVVLTTLFGPAWFFLPAILTHVARNDRVLAAFDLGTLYRITVRREYLVAWLVGAAVVLLGSMTYGLVGNLGTAVAAASGGRTVSPMIAIGLAGHAVGAAVNFYCQVVGFHVFGRGYRVSLDAAGGETEDHETEDGFDPSADDRGWGAETRAWRERRREERERVG